jgi:uncharacterized protein with WD repeat
VSHEPVLERMGRDHRNLRIWTCADGELVASFHQKGVTEDMWPFIQFDAEETQVFFSVKDAIVMYRTDGDMLKADRKVKLPGITQFRLGPSKRKHVAAFVPESSKPAVFALLDWEDGTTINRKNFFRVPPSIHEAKLLPWRGVHGSSHPFLQFYVNEAPKFAVLSA